MSFSVDVVCSVCVCTTESGRQRVLGEIVLFLFLTGGYKKIQKRAFQVSFIHLVICKRTS